MACGSADVQEKLKECISMFERCKQLVDQLALFSENEGIDDVASSEMKYLNLFRLC